MNYLYHWVPKTMSGDILYPLNILKEKYPEIYEECKGKYKGREEIMELVIPKINCLWNDALHLSAVHPKIIKDAIIEAGGRGDYKLFCYEIDPSVLDPEKTVVYLYSKNNLDMTNEGDFVDFKPDEISKYSVLSKETKAYYKESYNNKMRPLVFHRVPHILYKGSINIKDCPVVEV